MGVPIFLKNILQRILEKDSFQMPTLLQNQLIGRVQKAAYEDLGLRVAIKPREITTSKQPGGKTKAHVNLDVNVDKASLARLIEKAIYKKTRLHVTVSPNDLAIRDLNATVTAAHLNADLEFDSAELMKKL